MTSHHRGAPQTHRSSEPSGVSPRPSSRPAHREVAHRSAPAASPSRPTGLECIIPNPQDHFDLATDAPDNYRDSFISIVDDPFFRRFDDPAGHGSDEADFHLDPEDDATPRHEDTDDQHWVLRPLHRESLTIGQFLHWNSDNMETLNIALIGATGVGKSSFIQRVLGLSRPPITNASSVRLTVDNTTFGVTLLELDLEYFDMNPSHPIQWPKQINGHIVPRVDGAMILYDVTKAETMKELPQTVAALTKSGLPAVLIANKCDTPESVRQVDTQLVANHEFFKACVATYNLSSDSADKARACLHAIIRASVANRRDPQNGEPAAARRRAASTAHLEPPDAPSARPLSQHGKHNRASSEISVRRASPSDQYRRSTRNPMLGAFNNTSQPATSAQDSTAEEFQHSGSNMLRTPGVRLDRAPSDSFLDMDESDAESHRDSEDIPILQRNDESVSEKSVKPAGVTFDELVDRLVALRMSRADNNFQEVFLCLYRKFAAPSELFEAILARLDRVRDDRMVHYLTKTATQLRIIEVVARWVSSYPGDFARPGTRRNLEEFVRHLSTEPIFCIAARQIREQLECSVTEDDDTGWAKSDDAEADTVAGPPSSSSKDAVPSITDGSNGISSLYLDDDRSGGELRPSGSSDFSHMDKINSFVAYHSYEEYERVASTLEPTDVLPINKVRYHIFMDIPEDEIAREMTRIDWIMFSSIRVRDFVRHVSLPMDQRAKCKSLKSVNRIINHFNHIAKWAANLILLRDKPRHRAQMLEKFMGIATKLRRLNNYNGLAAVLAGINGTAVHRLAQTWALVPSEKRKAFAKLGILMGTQKSHFAYRLAWENSPLPRIPYMPLHRRDLVSAEEGSKTFVGPEGDRINWKKFEVLGEVLLPIMKSQSTPYTDLVKSEPARELILDCRIPTDDEEIYQRSVQVESTSGATSEQVKKKFPWFAK